jgi:glycosyltransferase involved in cell wall biosynthesis
MSDGGKKTKVFVISDHPYAPSGVGTQTKYIIETLLQTGRFQIFCFGGAVKHDNYQPQRTQEWGEDLTIFPVDGYGNQEMVRSMISQHRPDILWFMTDPRFYEWLWDMENEIRPNLPMVYYHVWDNYPYPKFNKNFYESTDVIATISKVTDDIVKTVTPDVESHYIPHAVDTSIFKPLPKEMIKPLRAQQFGPKEEDLFVCFWNNRNARRKMSGSVIWWFNEWMEANNLGPDQARLIMHTDSKDPNGQDLDAIIGEIGAGDGRVMISRNKIAPNDLATLYNIADATINISDAEGFGLATLESLACGTPIIVNMTGGLQEQVHDGENWFGIGIEPASRAVIGSLQVPYIYEDRVSKEDFHNALTTMFAMSKEQRKKLGLEGRKHVEKNYNFDNFKTSWIELMDSVVEKHGSWETRKGYNSWQITEIK